jgi:hypothetical protein
MDEMLSIALWIMIILMTVSVITSWFIDQPDFPTGLGLSGTSSNVMDTTAFESTTCTMTVWYELPAYAFCFIGKITNPILGYDEKLLDESIIHHPGLIDDIWSLGTNWQNFVKAVFGCDTDSVTGKVTCVVPAGNLFASILNFVILIIEIGAVIVILLRLAAIIRGSG